MTLADVNLWGRRIGAVNVDSPGAVAVFEYDPDFLASEVEPAPLRMPKRAGLFEFPALPRETFRGLPGMLWDSLPDKFGTKLIERYFRASGRDPGTLDVVEELCYVGYRGMGALTFSPAIDRDTTTRSLSIETLREFAAIAVEEDSTWSTTLESSEGMAELLEVGTSAGGARPKAVIGWNPQTNDVHSGRVDLAKGFEYWLLKFDGVGTAGRELGQSQGYGAIEYGYSKLAARAGLEMMPCHLFEETGRRHFMTQRFDRTQAGGRLHMQTLAGLLHIDFNVPGSGSYEDAFTALRALNAHPDDVEQLFLRMLFNIVFRNQDDHPKNISFLMDRSGDWRLAPAYDISFAYNPAGQYTSRHQMSLNGKLDDFTRDDFVAVARHAGLVQGRWSRLLERVTDAATEWRSIAGDVGIPDDRAAQIERTFRLEFRD